MGRLFVHDRLRGHWIPVGCGVHTMKVIYEYPMFMDLLEPQGALILDKRCHACWDYTRKAMRARELHAGGIENQTIMYKVGEELPHWHESRDEEIARSVALIYGLTDPSEFLHTDFIKRCWVQAKMLGLTVEESIYAVRPGVTRLQ
jgi:hypothetical protein